MAFCVNCGTKIEEGVKFCPGCGSQVGSVGVSINQEKAVNIIQTQPTVLPASNIPQNQNTTMAQTAGADEKYCFSCGSVIKKAAEMCPKCGVNQNKRSSTTAIDVFCTSCGKTIKKEASTCPFCGVRQEQSSLSTVNWTTLLILSILLGEIGVDRFYAGKIGTGILKLITFGGFFIWWIIDIIFILTGNFTDKNGNKILKN